MRPIEPLTRNGRIMEPIIRKEIRNQITVTAMAHPNSEFTIQEENNRIMRVSLVDGCGKGVALNFSHDHLRAIKDFLELYLPEKNDG